MMGNKKFSKYTEKHKSLMFYLGIVSITGTQIIPECADYKVTDSGVKLKPDEMKDLERDGLITLISDYANSAYCNKSSDINQNGDVTENKEGDLFGFSVSSKKTPKEHNLLVGEDDIGVLLSEDGFNFFAMICKERQDSKCKPSK